MDDLDEEEAFIEFEVDQRGEFRFGLVQGIIDSREGVRDGKPCIEWSWEGSDEMDPAMGRGWAVLEGDLLFGKLFFHLGDESAFRAEGAASSRGG
ncbi:hypothetical protein [Tautonia marina]|uniref:hypothetical protein n=1 Tax=Tautonia marina TaxID=2653855 RepID=UPI00191BCCBD|nr:hypothetical protein [Tautonia marina]